MSEANGFYQCSECSLAPFNSRTCKKYRKKEDTKIGRLEFIGEE